MWIFTKYGFFSAVCARQGKGESGQPVDVNRLMIRARLRSHLESLQGRFPDLLAGCEILKTAGSDYAYRLFVPKSQWCDLLAQLADETDYDNFKSEVAEHLGSKGASYESALHEVWDVMHRMQK
jgi:hypothetical protein